MSKNLGPVCKLCRREGEKLYLKGERCFTPKCGIERRNFAPGQHGRTGSRGGNRSGRESDYLRQLRAKQRARRVYGVLERQFHRYYEVARGRHGLTGLNLLQILESRLDNVVYRLGFAVSRRQARQLVRHGHVAVDGRKVNIPSYQVSQGEEITIRENSKKVPILEIAKEFASHQPLPNWLEIDRDNYKGKVLALPKREDINLPVNEQLIVELYSK